MCPPKSGQTRGSAPTAKVPCMHVTLLDRDTIPVPRSCPGPQKPDRDFSSTDQHSENLGRFVTMRPDKVTTASLVVDGIAGS